MKLINKIFLLGVLVGLVAFVGCSEDDLIDPTPSPNAPEGTQGVYFPTSNKSAFEFMPVDPTEFELKIARSVSEGAVEVPLTQDVNDENVFNVPSSVSFADGETETTFKVTFPTADEGKKYNLKLSVEGEQYVNPYVEGVPYVETSAMRVKWEPLDEPMVYVDGTFLAWFGVTSEPMYVFAERAILGDVTRYRFNNVYKVPTLDSDDNPIPDEDGIYDGYPYNEPGDFDESKDYVTIIEIGGDKGTANEVYMYSHQIGVEWRYGMHAIGSIYGNLTVGGEPASKDEYPLGVLKDSIITFPENSLYHELPTEGIAIAADPTTIYLSKAVYLEANKQIKDFNELEYEVIEGEESAFASQAFGESWMQTLAKAVDVDAENPESDYKNLYFLADLYSEGYGVAFYYDEDNDALTIPENQPIGVTVFGEELYVSQSNDTKSSVEIKDNGLVEYTLGMIFHYEDGTIVGDFAEKYLYSEDPIIYEASDFVGNYIMTGPSLFEGEPDAEMSVEIAEGENENELLITGLDFAEEVVATYDPLTELLSFEPQALADFGQFDISLLTVTVEGGALSISETAVVDLQRNIIGEVMVSPYSEGIGYVLESQAAGGYVDGYFDIIFTPSTEAASINTQSSTVLDVHSAFTTAIERSVNDKSNMNNFKVQGKKDSFKNRKLKMNQPGFYILK